MLSKRVVAGAVATATGLALVLAVPGGSATAAAATTTEYTVVAEDGATAVGAVAAIAAAGGVVVSRNDSIGVYRVESDRADFVSRVIAAEALIGASERRPIGYAPGVERLDAVEQENLLAGGGAGTGARGAGRGDGPSLDPLDEKLWGLAMVRSDASRRVEPGDRGVTVGVLDTGLDASNPDLAPNFRRSLSRNFAPDIEAIDGPCEVAGCVDAVGTDDNGHGTHVAGTIGAAANGLGVSGVAPKVSLVELKAGQDSGFFFLEPVVNALTHAADSGIDVVNMSFYVDPWLFNCLSNPADSPEAQASQQATIRGMSRALTYAHRRGVTLVGALGNNHEDLGDPRTDISSPNYGGTPYPRDIDNSTCWDLPVEGPFVIGVSALGPSGRKSDFSNYGTEQISLSAPGGWFRDGFGTDTYRTDANMILSSYPKNVLQRNGSVDADGNVVPSAQNTVFKQCNGYGECGYYTYLQGTSMAAPHAAGVAALIVSRFGVRDYRHRGLTMPPDLVERHLYRTAAERACPQPRLQSYAQEDRSAEFDAYCDGDEDFNGFYGHGIVDAYAAVTTSLRR